MSMSDAHDDELDRWLAQLAGRATDAAAPEAVAWRDALLAARQAPAAQSSATQAATDPQREAQLLAKARAAGLIADPPRPTAAPVAAARWPQWLQWLRWPFAPTAPAGKPVARRWAAGLAALAGVLLLVVVQQNEKPPADETPVLRGSGEVHVLRAADPAALQAVMLGELRALGIDAHGYSTGTARGIDADLPSPLPPALRAWLSRHGVPPPADGVLRIEITWPGSPP